MSMEIEAKLKIDSHDGVRARLKAVGATFVGRVLETNHILDTPEGKLRSGGCGLRVRECRVLQGVAPPPMLTFKGPRRPGVLKSREELETSVGESEAVLELFQSLGFVAALRFEKLRESWECDGCKVELDELPHLGLFVEIEGADEARVARVQESLRLKGHELITSSYISLLIDYCQRHNLSASEITFGPSAHSD
jgi:adenylate cyclase class 2